MKYNFEKKKSIWSLFHREIKLGCKIVILLGIAILSIIYKDTIGVMLNNNQEYKTLIQIVWYGTPILFIIIPIIYKYLVYLHRHLYIPLTQEELEKHNIYTQGEYSAFLEEYFMGLNPLNKVKQDIDEAKHKLSADTYYQTKDYSLFTVAMESISVSVCIGFVFIGFDCIEISAIGFVLAYHIFEIILTECHERTML